MMNCMAKEIQLGAKARLREIEDQLNWNKYRQGCRQNVFEKVDLIQERLQLKSVLGELEQERRPMGIPPFVPGNSHLTKDGIMKIEFESGISDSLRFYMVKEGQMFVSETGALFQKSSDSESEAWMICNSAGEPEGEIDHFDEDEVISKILPAIRRIAF